MDHQNRGDSTQRFLPRITRGNWLSKHKTKLRLLDHQRWWERSSKRKRNTRKTKTQEDGAQCTRRSKLVGEELKMEKKCSKQQGRTRRSSLYSSIDSGGRGAQKNEKPAVWKKGKSNVGTITAKNGRYLWISSETRKELISRPND